jgi:hypothetical protein
MSDNETETHLFKRAFALYLALYLAVCTAALILGYFTYTLLIVLLTSKGGAQ